ncbi:zincin-like metallopeptidase domain-containing protein [Niastella populi]|uniref:DUF1738 domain-containing protein n=1 Tax=Niastella populi TaxID=550983 RepID=A0A1V9GB22_9BACT|nr:zincin-like metallopeptidase domain-containing protein [Niastella populi]OQP67871.1 hypothetical protein A4R26_10215 [Niastella populi]
MNVAQKSASQDVHSFVTSRIIEQLTIGIIPWQEEWRSEHPQYMNGYPMDYINVLLLGILPYPRKVFFTAKQMRRNNVSTKRGEKGFTILGIRHSKTRPSLYCTTVYHPINLKAEYDDLLPAEKIVRNPIKACEKIIAGMPKLPRIVPDTSPAYYSLSADTISMPDKERFANEELYYSSLFYVLAQCTGHRSRMNRECAVPRHPDDAKTHTLEDLITEMTAGYLCNYASIAPSFLIRYHSDCDGWLRKIETDKEMVITAAMYAQEAINYILNRNPMLNPIQTGVYTP